MRRNIIITIRYGSSLMPRKETHQQSGMNYKNKIQGGKK